VSGLLLAAVEAGTLLYVSGALAVVALVAAVVLSAKLKNWSPGNDDMRRLSGAIRQGAMAFLKTEYMILSVFVVFLAIALTIFVDARGLDNFNTILGNGELGALIGGGSEINLPDVEEPIRGGTALCFIVGALCSVLAGFIGMRTATTANVRTTEAARTDIGDALRVAFSSGAVMGLSVVGLGLVGVVALTVMRKVGDQPFDPDLIFGFSLGASSIALFARVGGGIFTKAADVGADLVGKVEAGIPEDDPRNPATIADNVGDNVGDVAGMGADLFESYVGSIIASMAIGFSFQGDEDMRATLTFLPIVIAGVGILASLVGTFFVRAKDEKGLSMALTKGMVVAGVLLAGLAAGVIHFMGASSANLPGASFTGGWGIYFALIGGLVLGMLIGKVTEYYTSERMRHAKWIAGQSETGAATNIIGGLAVGMQSTGITIILIAIAVFGAYWFAGLYGIGLAAGGGQRRRHRGDEPLPAGGARAHRRARRAGQHDGGDRQGFRDRQCGADRARVLLRLRAEDRHRGEGHQHPRHRDVHRLPDRRHAAVHVQRDDDEGGRPRGQPHDRRGAPPVPRDRRDHGGHRRAGLRALRLDRDPRRAQGDDPARPHGGGGADRDRHHRRPRQGGGRRDARGCAALQRADGDLHGQLGRRLGQRQEVHRDRRARRQGLGRAQGCGRRRHRR
jgi:hypothetical protein